MPNVERWRGIVKVQRSLSPPDTEALIYSEDHAICFQGPMTPTLLQWFKRDQHKFYAYGVLVGTIIHLIRKAPEQAW